MRFAAALFIALCAGQALAQDEVPLHQDIHFLSGLHRQASLAVAGYVVPDLPAVQVVPAGEVSTHCRRCRASYRLNVISLSDQLDLKREFDRSVLFHELVHHVQEKTGKHGLGRSCEAIRDREREAYRLQGDYLVANGLGYRFPYRHVCHDEAASR